MGKIGLTRDHEPLPYGATKNLLSFENIKEKIPRWTPTRAELGGCLPQPNLDKIPQSCTTSTMQCLSEIKEVDITHLYTINRWSLSGSKHLLALLFCANNKMWMEKNRAFPPAWWLGQAMQTTVPMDSSICREFSGGWKFREINRAEVFKKSGKVANCC